VLNKKRYSTNIDRDILMQFIKLSEETLIPQTKLLDKALKLLLKEYGKIETPRN